MRFFVVLVLVVLLFPGSARADIDPSILEDLLELAKFATKREKIVVRSTECDAKCGVGSKTETRCFADVKVQNGPEVLSECEDIKVQCHGIWACGVKPYHADIGESLRLDCQTTQLVGDDTMSYHWTFAAGVITTDDDTFDVDVGSRRIVSLYNIQEKNAGTYRCQMEDSWGKLMKVIYFAVRVIDPSVFDLNVNRLLAKQQQNHLLAIKEAVTGKFKALSFKQQVFIILGVGIGGSVPMAIIIFVLLRSRRVKMPEEVDLERGDPEGEDPERADPEGGRP